MAEIEVLLLPNLKIFAVRASSYLMERWEFYDTLFLNFPREMEILVADLAEGRRTYESLIDEVSYSGIIPEPVEAWEYTAEPLLKVLPNLKEIHPGLKIYCYGTKKHQFLLNNIAIRAARLTLQTAITGKVDVEGWRRLLEESSRVGGKLLAEEGALISERARGRCLCLSGLTGRSLGRALSGEGHLVRVRFIGGVYHFTPLEILERRWRREPLTDEEIRRFVRYHLEYLRDYIYLSNNRDSAYYQWLHDKVPWLRGRIDTEAVRFLDLLKH